MCFAVFVWACVRAVFQSVNVLREADSAIVRWNFDAGFVERAHTVPTQLAEKESKFKDYVLPRPYLLVFARRGRCATAIICSKKDNSECNIRVVNELLDDCAARIWLLMEDDNIKS